MGPRPPWGWLKSEGRHQPLRLTNYSKLLNIFQRINISKNELVWGCKVLWQIIFSTFSTLDLQDIFDFPATNLRLSWHSFDILTLANIILFTYLGHLKTLLYRELKNLFPINSGVFFPWSLISSELSVISAILWRRCPDQRLWLPRRSHRLQTATSTILNTMIQWEEFTRGSSTNLQTL